MPRARNAVLKAAIDQVLRKIKAARPSGNNASSPTRKVSNSGHKASAVTEIARKPQGKASVSRASKDSATRRGKDNATSPRKGSATSPSKGSATSPDKDNATSPSKGSAISQSKDRAVPRRTVRSVIQRQDKPSETRTGNSKARAAISSRIGSSKVSNVATSSSRANSARTSHNRVSSRVSVRKAADALL